MALNKLKLFAVTAFFFSASINAQPSAPLQNCFAQCAVNNSPTQWAEYCQSEVLIAQTSCFKSESECNAIANTVQQNCTIKSQNETNACYAKCFNQ